MSDVGLTPELTERLRELVEDRDSLGVRWFARRKRDYLLGIEPLPVLTARALGVLGHKDEPVDGCLVRELAPTVERAMEVFRARNPDLDPADG